MKTGIGKISFGVIFLMCLQMPALCSGLETSIDVAPNVINLHSQAPVVTVHTDIEFSRVTCSSVALNAVPVDYCTADDRGYFVAKFAMDDIAALDLVAGEYNQFDLTGETIDAETFSGGQAILVVDNVPAGGKK